MSKIAIALEPSSQPPFPADAAARLDESRKSQASFEGLFGHSAQKTKNSTQISAVADPPAIAAVLPNSNPVNGLGWCREKESTCKVPSAGGF